MFEGLQLMMLIHVDGNPGSNQRLPPPKGGLNNEKRPACLGYIGEPIQSPYKHPPFYGGL